MDQHAVEALKSRVDLLEKENFKIKTIAVAVALALLIVASVTWVSLPGRAREAAEEKAKQIAKDYIENEGGFGLLKQNADAALQHAESSANAADVAKQKGDTILAEIEALRENADTALDVGNRVNTLEETVKSKVQFGDTVQITQFQVGAHLQTPPGQREARVGPWTNTNEQKWHINKLPTE